MAKSKSRIKITEHVAREVLHFKIVIPHDCAHPELRSHLLALASSKTAAYRARSVALPARALSVFAMPVYPLGAAAAHGLAKGYGRWAKKESAASEATTNGLMRFIESGKLIDPKMHGYNPAVVDSIYRLLRGRSKQGNFYVRSWRKKMVISSHPNYFRREISTRILDP